MKENYISAYLQLFTQKRNNKIIIRSWGTHTKAYSLGVCISYTTLKGCSHRLPGGTKKQLSSSFTTRYTPSKEGQAARCLGRAVQMPKLLGKDEIAYHIWQAVPPQNMTNLHVWCCAPSALHLVVARSFLYLFRVKTGDETTGLELV